VRDPRLTSGWGIRVSRGMRPGGPLLVLLQLCVASILCAVLPPATALQNRPREAGDIRRTTSSGDDDDHFTDYHDHYHDHSHDEHNFDEEGHKHTHWEL